MLMFKGLVYPLRGGCYCIYCVPKIPQTAQNQSEGNSVLVRLPLPPPCLWHQTPALSKVSLAPQHSLDNDPVNVLLFLNFFHITECERGMGSPLSHCLLCSSSEFLPRHARVEPLDSMRQATGNLPRNY